MRYPDSVEFLYSLGNELKTAKFGLENIRILLEELGNPQEAFPSIHVAGTNGKGSTSAMIAAALRRHGYRTGLYTSPHLIEPTERIRIDGEPVTRDLFVEAFNEVHEANESLISQGLLEHHTTYFETVTAMGFLLFRELDANCAVVEVGMGGRLDATNVLNPEVCAITPVDFDHEQFLGNSLSLIATEKAGILKPEASAVFARQRPEVQQVLDHRAAALGMHVVSANEYTVSDLQLHKDGSEFIATRERQLKVRCPLAGAHQVENALTAAAVLDLLHIPVEGIAYARWPARLQKISDAPEIILDGAHNPSGARALAEHIRRYYHDRVVWLIYGAMRDKSVEEITEILFPLAAHIVLTAPASPRSVRPESLASAAADARIRVIGNAAEALAFAKSVPKEDAVFITGSLYLAGEILGLLQ